MRRTAAASLIAIALAGGGCPAAPPPPPKKPAPVVAPKPAGPPAAERANVSDTYHGVSVDDPYRWLEEETPEVHAWVEGQNAYASTILDRLPELEALRAELKAIMDQPAAEHGFLLARGKALFALRQSPGKEQSELVVLDDPAQPELARLVLDPAADGDKTRAIDWFVPSPDGLKVAVSISTGGSESGALHLLNFMGDAIEPPIPNVQRGTGGGDVAWAPDGSGIYYTRYPYPGEEHADEPELWMRVLFHQLGTPVTDDREELGGLPRIAAIRLDADAKGRVLATVSLGDGGIFSHYLRDPKTAAWTQLTTFGDGVSTVQLAANGDLLLISTKDAPNGKVLRIGKGKLALARAKVLVPEGTDAIVTDFYDETGVVLGKDRMYLTYQVGGPTEVRTFTLAGKPAAAPQLPPVSSTGTPTLWQDDVLVWAQSYVTPRTYYRVEAKTGAVTELAGLLPKPSVDLSGYDVIRERASSKDGTAIPFTVVRPKGAPLDGSGRCIATGYGGFSSSTTPTFLRNLEPMLRRGVCFVETNLRGGREFGEAWHQAGMLTQKQNVFDDFAAVLERLIERGYTRRERLALVGASNGGLLMGAMLTQHPQLASVVVSSVGIYDMLRNELTQNGRFNTSEYGSVENAEQFAALHAYSPYHHVPMGTKFPAVLFTTGDNDPRVASWHSRKMLAGLQHANSGDAPILLRTSSSSGHGVGSPLSELIDQRATRYAFILAHLK
jgi:prolyl oligopeptidase